MAFLRFVFLALLAVGTAEQGVTESPCGSSPCEKGTTCESDGKEYKCRGDPCDSNPCQDGEICQSDGSQYICVSERDPCDSSPCKDGESCLSDGFEYTCVCSGVNCPGSEDLCDTIRCANGGTCVSEEDEVKCVCTEEYTGDYCQVPRVLLGNIGKCEDGVRVRLLKKGNFGIESCVNAKPFYQYYCQGPCKKKKHLCVPIAGDDQEIPMQTLTGGECEPYMNAVIKRCDCSARVITPVQRECRLVKRTYKPGTYSVSFGRKKCKNKSTYSKSYCRGSCPDKQKCRGKYERLAIQFSCKEGKRKSTFNRVELSAIKCNCDCLPIKG